MIKGGKDRVEVFTEYEQLIPDSEKLMFFFKTECWNLLYLGIVPWSREAEELLYDLFGVKSLALLTRSQHLRFIKSLLSQCEAKMRLKDPDENSFFNWIFKRYFNLDLDSDEVKKRLYDVFGITSYKDLKRTQHLECFRVLEDMVIKAVRSKGKLDRYNRRLQIGEAILHGNGARAAGHLVKNLMISKNGKDRGK